jgi:hypothetical protein
MAAPKKLEEPNSKNDVEVPKENNLKKEPETKVLQNKSHKQKEKVDMNSSTVVDRTSPSQWNT